VKIKYNMYFFEVQNMNDALKGKRPKLAQLGPYIYDEYYVKFDIVWTNDGDTVTYHTQKYWIYNAEDTEPGLSQYDNITLPYTSVVGFANVLASIPASVNDLLDAAVNVCDDSQFL
jgi:hypothetical protein